MKPFFYYIALIGTISAILTRYDKIAAIGRKRRIPESSLLWIALLGGALPMYLVMIVIRHKTRHKKFMILLPLMAVLHTAIVCFAYFLR